jgi:hypothetical protein
MTNIRSRGFDSPAQLLENLGDVDDELEDTAGAAPLDDGAGFARQAAVWRREIAWLRKDVADLGDRLSFIPGQAIEEHAKGPGSARWVGFTALAVLALSTLKLAKAARRDDMSAVRRSR